ncbi:MAG: polymer-forming cytoskeletal protein [Lachnospiraceae bacterium]|nr:polymer-forming cytoskeletal protein [Lachnospiraceae bacterium]
MGFFSDLKNDLTQAVTEMTDEKAKEEILAEEERLKKELSELEEKENPDLFSILEEVEELEEIQEEGAGSEEIVSAQTFNAAFGYKQNYAVENGSLEIAGNIVGNLTIPGKLTLCGEMHGTIQAESVVLRGAKIEGDIVCRSGVEMDDSSMVIGNIIGNGAVIAGALKGDVDVDGPVVLESTAIIQGNMKAKSVQMNSGAVIEGMISQCYAQVNPSTFFNGMNHERR